MLGMESSEIASTSTRIQEVDSLQLTKVEKVTAKKLKKDLI